MEHTTAKTIQIRSRHGFYFPAGHIDQNTSAIEEFIPFAQSSGTQRAVLEMLSLQSLPVSLINQLVEANISVDIFLKTNLQQNFDLLAYRDMINNAANLKVERLILFDRPNQQDFWSPQTWIKPELMDIFLEKFILLAELCLEKNIQPVFPPLQPAGDYWDTAFLRLALQKLHDQGKTEILDSLCLSAYAWTYDRSILWGAGGPHMFPATIPYYTPEGSQDQQGFRIFDWYQTNVKAVLNRTLPIILLQAGRQAEYVPTSAVSNPESQLSIVQDILEGLYPSILMNPEEQDSLKVIPEEVVCCNFLVDLDWQTLQGIFTPIAAVQSKQATSNTPDILQHYLQPSGIEHYLLLPDESWRSDPHKAAALKPFINKFQPSVGTSLDAALDAKQVTLVVTEQDDAQEKISVLQQQENILLRKIRVQADPPVENTNDH